MLRIRNSLISGCLLFSLLILHQSVSRAQNGDSLGARSIPIISFKEMQTLLDNPGDTLYIVNFWATWCKPCVMELPDFERVHEEYKDSARVKVLLVSLDFPERLETVVKPFLDRTKTDAEVWLLDEPDANAWIDKVDPSWSGAIPATIFLHRNYHAFHEGTMTYEELIRIINNPKLKS